MIGECHAHLFMDGVNYRQAVEDHKRLVNIEKLKLHLQAYQELQIPFVRDGGDCYGVSEMALHLAPQYGIDYRSPIFAIHREGHYGKIVGKGAADLKEFAFLTKEVRRRGGNFIKIMVSGIMEYSGFGVLSEEALEKKWIYEMIHIAHEEGFSVMVHANGKEAVLPAVLAGADSVEHGNYIDEECMDAMKEKHCIWVPTIVTTKNLIGCGRYDDNVLKKIYRMECENLQKAYEKGVILAVGSDAGAYCVPHGKGVLQEAAIFKDVLTESGVSDEQIETLIQTGENEIKDRF